MRPGLTLAAAAVAVLGVLGGSELALPSGPAGATSAANCSSGVIVAADFSPWKPPPNVNSVCDPSLPPNAAQALVAADFDPVGVATYPPLAFICTIAGYPQGADCNTTPPGNAYWSFWYANADTWTYSELGATALTPVAGSVEYWEFGGASAADPPTTSPDWLRSNTSTPPTTTTTSTTSPVSTPPTAPSPATVPVTGPAAGSTSGSGGDGSGNASSHPASSGAGTSDNGTEASTGGSGASDPGGSDMSGGSGDTHSSGSTSGPSSSTTEPDRGRGGTATDPAIVNAAPVVAAEQPSGSSVPFTLGAVAIALLAGTGGLIAWRRRRTD